ncbi:MAG: GxxExxY protein [Planctomycetaceae bacterium]
MHPRYSQADQLTGSIIAAAIEVHRTLGPGLLESIYERCLRRELELRSLNVSSQQAVKIRYKDMTFEESLKFDILVEDCVLVEIKAVQGILPIHKAQVMSYMKLMDVPLGLLFNFHELTLMDGFARMMLAGANRS